MSERNIEEVVDRVNAALQLIGTIKEEGHEDVVSRSFRLSGSPAEYVSLAIVIHEAGIQDELLRHFRPEFDAPSVVAYLKEQCNAGSIDRRYAGALHVLLRVEVDWAWVDLVDALLERLTSGGALEGKEIVGDVECLMTLDREGSIEEARNALDELGSSGHLMHHFYQAQSENDPVAMAACVAPVLAQRPDGAPKASVGNSRAGHQAYKTLMTSPDDQPEFVKALSELIVRFDLLDSILQNAATTELIGPCVNAVLRVIVTQEDDFRRLRPEEIINNYSYMSNGLSESELRRTVAQADEKGILRIRLRQDPFDPQLANLYVVVYQESRDDDFVKFLRNGLRKIDAETWLDEFNRTGALVELTLDIIDEGSRIGLSSDFQEALLNHAKSVLDEGTQPGRFEDRWSGLLNALNRDAKETFLRDLRDEVLIKRKQNCQSLLRLYGSALLDAHLEEKADDVVRGLFREMAGREHEEELGWLLRVLREKSDVYRRAPRPSQKTFEKELESTLKSEDVTDEIRALMLEIARLLDLDVPEQSESDEG